MSAGEILLINPRAKRRSKKRRHMSALQKQYFGKRRRTTSLASNPRRRRRSRKTTRLARNPRRLRSPRVYARAARRFRRNPRRAGGGGKFLSSGNLITHGLIPAGIGAAGALAIDMAWDNLPIPDALKTGTFAPVTRVGLAIGLGFLGSMVMGRQFGAAVMVGAVTVTAYDLSKGFLATALPATTGGGNSGGVAGYVDGMAGYVSGREGMSFYNAGAVAEY